MKKSRHQQVLEFRLEHLRAERQDLTYRGEKLDVEIESLQGIMKAAELLAIEKETPS